MNIFNFLGSLNPVTIFQKGKDTAMQSFVNSIIRHAATSLGGMLLSHGYLAQDQVQLLIGAIVTLGGVAWAIVDKFTAAKVNP
jgi:hypothetical protein